MFKKRFAVLIAAALFACVLFIPQVSAAAESVLSVFRVAEVKTISVTVNDLQDMMTYARQHGDTQKEAAQTEIGAALHQLLGKAESDIKPIESIRDFTAFPFSLPTALKDETPKLYAAGTQAQSVTLDTSIINAELKELGATTLVDEKYNGAVITVSTPAAAAASYADVMLAETQNIVIDASDDVMNNIWSAIMSIPAIPENIRAQLISIDPRTRDIYLPVIEGLGREIDLGSTTGYLYSSGSLAQVLGMLPDVADAKTLAELQNAGASALVWTKDGVLYYLAGEKTDSELAQIARSIR
jgi:hypothetical protein